MSFRTRRPSHVGRGDLGGAAVELLVLGTVFSAFIATVVWVGRMNLGNANVEAAARTAARTLAMARDPYAVVADAEAEAASAVDAGSSMCPEMAFDADITATDIQVTVECSISTAQSLFAFLPGEVEADAQVTEVRDRYRSSP